MKKDILFLCQFFYPEYNSSATLPFDTAKYLVKQGFTVDALCGYPKEYCKEENVPLKEYKDGVEIKRIKYIQLARSRKWGRLINYFSFTAFAFLHLPELRRYKCVIVYSNPPILPIVPIIANNLFKTKFIFVAYDIYPEIAFASGSLRPGSIIDKVMGWINRRLYKKAAHVVALTDEMKEFVLAKRPQLTADRIITIANWAHEKECEKSCDAYERFGYNEGQFVVSYFGNMGTCQDIETMMEAAELLKDDGRVKFLIVGHGNKKAKVEARIRDKKLSNVQLLNFLTGIDFEQAIAISSCCIVSLKKGLKGTCAPSKYYSYLQGGKPVLAVIEEDSYLAKEVEDKKIGYVIEAGDSTELKNAIIQMVENEAECQRMGSRARELYESEYACEKGLSKYCEMFKKMLKE